MILFVCIFHSQSSFNNANYGDSTARRSPPRWSAMSSNNRPLQSVVSGFRDPALPVFSSLYSWKRSFVLLKNPVITACFTVLVITCTFWCGLVIFRMIESHDFSCAIWMNNAASGFFRRFSYLLDEFFVGEGSLSTRKERSVLISHPHMAASLDRIHEIIYTLRVVPREEPSTVFRQLI